MPEAALHPAHLRALAAAALAEDVGAGDATTLAVVPADLQWRAAFVARQPCVVAGMPLVAAVFAELDPEAVLDIHVPEGHAAAAGQTLAEIRGNARAILTGERTALNYLQRLSGIATIARRYADAVRHTRTRILDTRKTTPGLRLLEKYAVAVGGATNHRFGLFDRVLIKDNHLAVAAMAGPGAIGRAIAAARRAYPTLEVEVETETLEQVREALAADADYILLDNMDDATIQAAVAIRDQRNARCLLEASGRMTLERLAAVAATGVDFISAGALTHSAPACDIALDALRPTPRYPDAPG